MLDHTALFNKRRTDWTVGGYNVNIEHQNSLQAHRYRPWLETAGGIQRLPSARRYGNDCAGLRFSESAGG